MTQTTPVKLTRRDFQTEQDVRWCPGCGDYSILAAVQKVLPTLGIPREDFVIVSGIGCAARFPYYLDTYGIHGIHGRAPAIASGVKIARPDLSVWVISGDGDALSIGGNHLLHVLRRNVNVNILLFNNQIYGLTKGQTSPTTSLGKATKSTPMGSAARPVNPLAFALGSAATFVARTIDRQPKHLTAMLHRAYEHKGTSFVEILQNCNIFNDGAYLHLTDRKVRDDQQLVLEPNKPLVFGAERNKGIRFVNMRPEVIEFDPANPPQELATHDEAGLVGYQMALAEMAHPDFPTPIGVLRAVETATYEDLVIEQIERAKGLDSSDLQDLVEGGETWDVH